MIFNTNLNKNNKKINIQIKCINIFAIYYFRINLIISHYKLIIYKLFKKLIKMKLMYLRKNITDLIEIKIQYILNKFLKIFQDLI